MPSNEREYRSLELTSLPEGGEEFRVEGYASTFDAYPLTVIDGETYFERFEPDAFDGADLTDVVFRVDHEGPVYARTSNGSIQLDVDGHGLHQITDLGRTARARSLFDDIRAGMYPQMSFAFTAASDRYERETRTRVVEKVKKVYDISAVSFPANPGTELSARAALDGVIERETAERLEAERKDRRRAALRLRARLLELDTPETTKGANND